MSQFSKLQKEQFESALKTATAQERKLFRAYRRAQRKALKRMKQYKELWLTTERLGLANAEQLYNELGRLIEDITGVRQENIIQTASQIERETYYASAYGYERQVNIDTQFLNAGKNSRWALSFPVIPEDAIAASLTDSVGGMTFKDRGIKERLFFQNDLQEKLAASIAGGDSIDDAAEILKDSYGWAGSRARTTARTEILRAHSYGHEKAREEAAKAGVEIRSIWDATLDGETRPTHQAMDGTEAEMIDGTPYFTLAAGVRVTAPRMPALPARESINCRCRRVDLPKGFNPTTRGRRVKGKWQSGDDIKYKEWIKNKSA